MVIGMKGNVGIGGIGGSLGRAGRPGNGNALNAGFGFGKGMWSWNVGNAGFGFGMSMWFWSVGKSEKEESPNSVADDTFGSGKRRDAKHE